MEFTLKINFERELIEEDEEKTLYQILYKNSIEKLLNRCEDGKCGNCLILLDKKIIPSCMVSFIFAIDSQIINYQGIKKTDEYTKLIKAFENNNYYGCDNCFEKIITYSYYFLINDCFDKEKILDELGKRWCNCSSFENYFNSIISLKK